MRATTLRLAVGRLDPLSIRPQSQVPDLGRLVSRTIGHRDPHVLVVTFMTLPGGRQEHPQRIGADRIAKATIKRAQLVPVDAHT